MIKLRKGLVLGLSLVVNSINYLMFSIALMANSVVTMAL